MTNGFTFTLTVNGKRKTMTREGLDVLSPPCARTTCGSRLSRTVQVSTPISTICWAKSTKRLVNDWKAENLQLRRFASPIATRNLGNDIPDDAVDVASDGLPENAGIFQDYFRIKARLCKIKPMSRYHIYAPHRTRSRNPIAIRMPSRMVLDAYRGFSPQLADLAERVVHERHIDAPTEAGKIGGAYCYSVVPDMTPYVHAELHRRSTRYRDDGA